ncbi:hypothetical protein AW736_24755, partial [Termitidicoccus mucosus]
ANNVLIVGATAATFTATNNSAGASGGVLYVGRGLGVSGSLVFGGRYAAATIAGNRATGNGGALATDQGSIFLTATIAGLLDIRGNTAATGGAIHSGGDLFISGSYGSALFRSNTASANGGALNAAGSLTLGGAYAATGTLLFASNTAAGRGGALYAGNAVRLSATTGAGGTLAFTGNTAGAGGAIGLGAGGTLTFTNASPNIVFLGNTASGAGGGALYSSGSLTLGGTTGSVLFQRNSAASGAAIYADGALTLRGAYASLVLDSNTAAQNGGAMISQNGRIVLSATAGSLVLAGNYAGGAGGALVSSGTDIIISGSYGSIAISNNTAGSYGGALAAGGYGSITLDARSGGSYIVANNTAAQNGGAFFVANSFNLNLASGTFLATGNRALSGDGGFLYVQPMMTTGSILFNIGADAAARIGDASSIAAQADSIATGYGVNLHKTGGGLLELWGDNTITGGTTIVTGGTLHLPGSITSIGAVIDGAAGVVDASGYWNTQYGDFTVGRSSAASVTLAGSGSVNSNAVTIGGQSGATGTVALSGLSRWSSNGASLIGDQAGAAGVLTVGGSAYWFTEGHALTIGNAGAGAVVLADSGSITTNNGVTFGALATGVGTGTLAGSAYWDSGNNAFTVGGAGTGALTLAGSAHITGGPVIFGDQAGALGTGTIAGSGFWDTHNIVFTVGNSGTGALTLAGSGSISSAGVTFGAQTGGSGTGAIAGAALWNVLGDFRLGGSGIGALAMRDSGSLRLTGNYAQNQDSTLSLDLGGQPRGPYIDAMTASLSGTLNIIGFGGVFSGASATDVQNLASYVLIHTANGITDDFTYVNVNAGLAANAPDFVIAGAHKSADNRDYVLGFDLAWFADTSRGHGYFTLPGPAAFDVNVALVDETHKGAFTTGWDGKSLTVTSSNSGTLVLSANNTYTGTTTVDGGVLRITGTTAGNAAGVIGGASGTGALVEIASGASWQIAGGLAIGATGTGELSVQAGGSLATAGPVAIGGGSGTANSKATVTGVWRHTTGDFDIDSHNADALIVAEAGRLFTDSRVSIGNTLDSLVGMVVQDTAFWDSGTGNIVLGNTGFASVELRGSGSILSGGTLTVGAAATGTAVISGSDSTLWHHAGEFVLGDAGFGQLLLKASGSMQVDNNVILANQAGSNGQAWIHDHSRLNVGGDFINGVGGSGILRVDNDGRLDVGGTYAQSSSSLLRIIFDSVLRSPGDAFIYAGNASLSGTLNVLAFTGAATGTTASAIANSNKLIIRTHTDIQGDFDAISVISSDSSAPLDFILLDGYKANNIADTTSNSGTDYYIGFNLAWLVSDTRAHGNFTLDAGRSFDVNVSLGDEPPTPATSWDGKSLAKSGRGNLILSAGHSYSGTTFVYGGTLTLTGTGQIAGSAAALINGGMAIVNGTGYWTATGNPSGDGQFIVGGTTNSTLQLTASGSIDSTAVRTVIGSGSTATGAANLSGSGRWTGSDFILGENGSGNVTLNNAAEVHAANTILGHNSRASGILIVNGSARWNNDVAGVFTVGDSGTGSMILFSNALISSGTVVFGGTGGGRGTAVLSGSATWDTNGRDFIIGDSGTGVLELTNNSRIHSGTVVIGAKTGSSNQVTITNSAFWDTNGAAFVIGDAGDGVLSLQGSGSVSSGALILGRGNDPGFGGALQVAGSGYWTTNGNDVTVGGETTGAVVMQGSGSIRAGSITLGLNAGATGTGLISNSALMRADGDFLNGGAGVGELQIRDSGSLSVGGLYEQSSDSLLQIVLTGTRGAFITAGSAALSGTLTVSGFSGTVTGTKASDVGGNSILLIRTGNVIAGDFGARLVITPTSGLPDFIIADAYRASNGVRDEVTGTDYVVGFGLAWFSDTTKGHGSFTLDAGHAFNVDVSLVDEDSKGTFATGAWDGKSLTKLGAGTLVLSSVNTYSGATIIREGGLLVSATGANAAAALGTGTLVLFDSTTTSGTLLFDTTATMTQRQVVDVDSAAALANTNPAALLTVTAPAHAGDGGAVHVNAGGTYNLLGDIAFAGNNASSASGGAIYLDTGATLGLGVGGIAFTGNTAGAGGAVSGRDALVINGGGGALVATDNRAGSTGGAFDALGDIRLSDSYGAIVIAGNTAGTFGGALYSHGGGISITATAGVFTATGNTAAAGGFAYAGAGGITLAGLYDAIRVAGNSATAGSGGAIYGARGVSINVSDSLVIQSNTAAIHGGAVYSGSDFALTGSFEGILIEGNISGTHGGAVYAEGDAAIGGTVGGDILITGNSAITGYGGAIYSGGALALNATAGGGIHIDGNTSGTSGGALFGNGAITINSAAAGTLSVTNNASNGGGALTSGASITIGGSYGDILIASNTARVAGGGAFAASLGSIAVDTLTSGSLVIRDNYTALTGGAFTAGGAASAITIGGTYGAIAISSNTASGAGAFRAANGASLVIDAVADSFEIVQNTASGGVGGVAVADGAITIGGHYGSLLVSSNTASLSSGAFYSGGDTTLTGSHGVITIAGNTALTGGGGAFWAGGDLAFPATAASLVATDNAARNGAGGFAGAAGAVIIDGDYGTVTITNNISGTGGAIYSGGNFTLRLASGDTLVATGNLAADEASGGFLYVNSGSILFDIAAGADAQIGFQFSRAMQADSIATGADVNLVKAGAGLLMLWANNTVSGTSLLLDGTLAMAAEGSLATGVYEQEAGATLSLDLSGAPRPSFITATAAQLSGTLDLLNASALIAGGTKASELAQNNQVLIHTTDTITGGFTGTIGVNGAGAADYLVSGAFIVGGTDYVLGSQLAWFSDTTASHGNFTLGADETFEVDVPLGDTTPHAAGANVPAWDGASLTLTASNSGTLILSASNNYSGTTTVNGGVLEVTGWTGSTAQVNIASAANSSGTVSVSGYWNTAGNLIVGGSGSGALLMSGGTVRANSIIIGGNSTGVGTGSVGAGALLIGSGGINVGGNGSGTLIIAAGGTARGNYDRIGDQDGDATLLVEGVWTNTTFRVGIYGDAALTISGTGMVLTAANGSINDDASNGHVSTALLTGSGWWDVGTTFTMGGYEGTGSLAITQSGSLTVGTDATIGSYEDTSFVNVSGSGLFRTGSNFTLGNASGPATLFMSESGSVRAGGTYAQGANGTLSITHTGTLGSRGAFVTAASGTLSGTLTVNAGGTAAFVNGGSASALANNSQVLIRTGTISGGFDTVTVTGGTSTHDFLTLGAFIVGGTDYVLGSQLTWYSGTATAHGNFTLGAGETFTVDVPLNNTATPNTSGWDGASLTVTASNSGTLILSASNNYSGTTTVNGGVLEVTGWTGSTAQVNIASAANSSGTVSVSGYLGTANSGINVGGWQASDTNAHGILNLTGTAAGSLNVGRGTASTGEVNVSGNGALFGNSDWIGNNGALGTVNVTDSGSWSNGWLYVGYWGGTGVVNVSGTGVVTATTAYIGYYSYEEVARGELNVSGSGWFQAGELSIGHQGFGTGATLEGAVTLTDSGSVTAGNIVIANSAGGGAVTTGSASVGGNALLASATNIILGNGTNSAALAVSGSGLVTAGGAYAQNAQSTLTLDAAGDGVTARGAGDAFIYASSATVGGTISVSGFATGSAFADAQSVVNSGHQVLISATSGTISGVFASATLAGVSALPDYLYGGIYKTTSGSSYVAGVNLAWFGDAASGHGNFTVAGGTSFDVNTTLSDTMGLAGSPAYASGWDGRSLTVTASNSGTLILSGSNTHTGTTTVNGGALAITGWTGSNAAGLIDGGAGGAANLIVSGSGYWGIVNGGDLRVGKTGTGSLTITGGTVNAGSFVYLGYDADAVGTGTVGGGGLLGANMIIVGEGGVGSLSVTGGVVAANTWISIGDSSNGLGTVGVGAGGLMTSGNNITVGNSGTGALVIAQGGTASAVGEIRFGYLGGVGSGTVGGVLAGSSNFYVGSDLGGTGALAVGGSGSVTAGGAYTQNTRSTLDLTLSGSLGSRGAFITAGSAQLSGTLTVNATGTAAFVNGGSASALANNAQVLLHTGGISGDFAAKSVSGGTSQKDFLTFGAFIVGGTDYVLGTQLTWLSGTDRSHGNFTLGEGEVFNVDVALGNTTPHGANLALSDSWDGASLTVTSSNRGDLILSASNSYSGTTLVNGGTLTITGYVGGTAGVIGSGSGTDGTVNLSGSGQWRMNGSAPLNIGNNTGTGALAITDSGTVTAGGVGIGATGLVAVG